MSVFPIPVGVAKKIEKLQRDLFWNDGHLKKKVHAVDWETICNSKRNGGLGVGRMRDKGLSLLAKWIWRFGREDSFLWKKVICAKYDLGQNPLLWKSNSVKSGSHFFYGDQPFFYGESLCSQYNQKWLPSGCG